MDSNPSLFQSQTIVIDWFLTKINVAQDLNQNNLRYFGVFNWIEGGGFSLSPSPVLTGEGEWKGEKENSGSSFHPGNHIFQCSFERTVTLHLYRNECRGKIQ